MTPIAITACAVVLWSCAATTFATDAPTGGQMTAATAADGPSLAEMSQLIESKEFDFFGTWSDNDNGLPAEGRGKKPNPMQIAMAMAGSAAGSMMMMKMVGAIKLFIIHSFLATKLGLIVGAYLLVCKLMEMKQMPAKKTVKWVSPPPSFEEHPSSMTSSMVAAPYPDSIQSYEPQQQDQQAPSDQYGPPPSQQQQQYMPSGDFGGGDMQAHYSHVSPVTYRPMITRNQPDNLVKSSAAGRVHS